MNNIETTITAIQKRLREVGDPKAIPFMAKYGIKPEQTYGVKIPHLRAIAGNYRKNHELALVLWKINNRETRILATMIDDPKDLTEQQMEAWAMEFSYWEICDQACMNLFEKHPLAWSKAVAWSKHANEGKKRAAFVLMARLAVNDKKAQNAKFEHFFPFIIRESSDERNLVKKAVNWALRQIGKRNKALNQQAIQVAEQIAAIDSKNARWIAADALRELKSEAIQRRLKS